MSEHEMCCGTTCDKQAVAAEIDQLRKERDEALAYGERLRKHGYNCAEELAMMIDTHNVQNNDDGSWLYDGQTPFDLMEAIHEQPPSALEALKAEWQAVGAMSAWVVLKRMGMAQAGSKNVIQSMVLKLRKRAQEAE